jgi:hypothetical protein
MLTLPAYARVTHTAPDPLSGLTPEEEEGDREGGGGRGGGVAGGGGGGGVTVSGGGGVTLSGGGEGDALWAFKTQELASLAWALGTRIRQHTSAYVSVCYMTQELASLAWALGALFTRFTAGTKAPSLYWYQSTRGCALGVSDAGVAYVSMRQHTSAYVSIRQHTSAYVSIRQNTSEYVSIRR